MARQQHREEDPVEEILRIAMRNQGGPDLALRQRLLASAAELGISEQAALEAEQQWQEQKHKEAELRDYKSHILRSLYLHLGVYAVVNTFLVLLNMLTSNGRIDWAPYVIVSWGIAIGCHLVAALVQLKNPGGEEFDDWQKGKAPSRPPRVTIGMHIEGVRRKSDQK